MSGAAPVRAADRDGGAVPGARLRGLLRRPYPSGARTAKAADGDAERCDLCAEKVPERHRHMLDADRSAVLCTCGPCALLFGQSAAGGRHYLLLPERRLRLGGFRIGPMLWARLGVPVGLAFFVRDGASGQVSVGYPSPLGVTRSAVGPEVWEEVTRGYPESAGIADDVEALLVHRTNGTGGADGWASPQSPASTGINETTESKETTESTDEHWIVPLDDCYRLAAVVRTHWRGLSGGPEVREHIDAFFAGLTPPEGPTASRTS